MTRAELIATLVTDKYSGFKDGDEPILEAASDARLEEFRSASAARKLSAESITRLETDNRNMGARLKVAEERIRTSEQEMTEDEFLSRAPATIKTLIETHKAEEAAVRQSLISQLKDLGANTEAELKMMKTEELKTLAKYARVEVLDFSGRGMPVNQDRNNDIDDYTPPDVYGPGIKALQAAGK